MAKQAHTATETDCNLEVAADGAEVGLVLVERHVLVRLHLVGQRGVVGAEEDGDGRRVRRALHGPRQHLERPPRVVPAEAAQHHVRLDQRAGAVSSRRAASAASEE